MISLICRVNTGDLVAETKQSESFHHVHMRLCLMKLVLFMSVWREMCVGPSVSFEGICHEFRLRVDLRTYRLKPLIAEGVQWLKRSWWWPSNWRMRVWDGLICVGNSKLFMFSVLTRGWALSSLVITPSTNADLSSQNDNVVCLAEIRRWAGKTKQSLRFLSLRECTKYTNGPNFD